MPFARSIDPAKVDVTVACIHYSGGTNEERVRATGVRVVNLGAKSLRDLAAMRRLLALIREQKIDVIHAHLTFATIWSALASRRTGVPAIATLHVSPAATRSLRSSMRHRVMSGIRDGLMKRIANRWTRVVVAVSAALRNEYAANGMRADKMRVIHNGIELDRFRRPHDETRRKLEAEFDIRTDSPIAATVSVLRPGKGIEVLLAAIREIPRATFLLIGDGPTRDELTAVAQQHGVADRVRWAGYRTDVDTLLAGCDLFIHPSLDDAFPTVLLEAMAAGLPVVASNVGGIPEIVTPGVTGMLVPPGDARVLSEAVSSLLADAKKLEAMRAAAFVGSERFSTRVWVDRLTDLYAEVARS